jgi:hypothetical protein
MSDGTEDRLEKATAAAATAGAAIYAYFSADLLEVAPAWVRGVLGTTLAVGVASLWLGALTSMKSRLWWVMSIGCTALGGVGLFAIGGWAFDQSRVNDTRCANIQREMLFPKPRRADLPDLFSALKCRPQGLDDVQMPKLPPPSSEAIEER